MKILIAVDGSEFSSVAVDLSSELIKCMTNAEVKLVTVMQPAAAMDIEMYIESLEELKDPANPNYQEAVKLCESSVKQLSERLDGTAANLGYEVLVGPAAQSIVEYSEKWEPDLIVLGSHGRGFWERMWLGSVADRVVHHAPCSVLIARKQ